MTLAFGFFVSVLIGYNLGIKLVLGFVLGEPIICYYKVSPYYFSPQRYCFFFRYANILLRKTKVFRGRRGGSLPRPSPKGGGASRICRVPAYANLYRPFPINLNKSRLVLDKELRSTRISLH